MDAIAADVSIQMSALNNALVDFNATMVDLVGNPPIVSTIGQHVNITRLSEEESSKGLVNYENLLPGWNKTGNQWETKKGNTTGIQTGKGGDRDKPK